MAFLDSQQVAFHRQQLMDMGCTVIKGVWDDDFTSEMRDWSNAIIDENPPDEKFRFQGSDIHVFTEERWDRRVHLELSSTRMPDANAARIIDHPTQTQVCKDMGFGLTAAQEWVIMLSKPSYNGHPDELNRTLRYISKFPKTFIIIKPIDTSYEII